VIEQTYHGWSPIACAPAKLGGKRSSYSTATDR